MTLETDWDEVVSELRKNYPSRKIREEDDRVEVEFSPSTNLLIRKDGFVEGSMPLHHFSTDEAREVEVRSSITVVSGEDFEYMFKK